MRTRALIAFAFGGGVVLACSAIDGDRQSFSDQGALCLRATEAGGVRVTVTFPTCLSSSCDRAVATSCTVTRSGDQLVIRSRGEYEATGARSCTGDCRFLQATCESEPLEPGDYVIIHGTDSATVSLPNSQGPLFGAAGPRPDCSQ